MKTSFAARAAAPLVALLALSACSSDDPSSSGPVGPSMGIVEIDPTRIQLGEAPSTGGSGHGGSTSTAGSANGGSPGKSLQKIGKPCETSDDCPTGLFCRYDSDYIAHKQCTLDCDDSATCEAAEKGAFCIGAQVCVHACTTQADCGPKTKCGSAGWCERTGPGSGVPYCAGLATPCSLLTGFECTSSSGCRDDSRCSGVAESCYSQFSSFSCNDVEGCYWSSSSESCSGSSRSCSGFSLSSSCVSQPGCNWSESCSGIARSCDETLTALCTTQPGCSLVTD